VEVRQVGDQFGSNFMLRHLYSHPVELMLALGTLCSSGVLDRHPKLQVAFLEGNCSWLPWLLWRMDEHWEMFGDVWAPEQKLLPSEYFKRQCFVSVEPDEEPVKYVSEHVGNDRLVFSTDFPHVDSKFPHAVEGLLKLPVADEDKRKILWDNCAAYYGVTQPAAR
jgi:predicted TIM-barrel fold metal-dependent hydrolase